MSSNDIQLEMNFSEKQNRFRKAIEQGEFSLLIESAVPAKQLSSKEAVAELRVLEEAVLEITELKAGLAIPDRNENQEAWSAIEFAAHLPEESRDRHVVYLSGRNRDMKEIDRQLAIAANAGNYHKFTSAAARLELSVYNKDKKLLATGAARETLAGASYPIAAKDAIARTALKLAGEFFPVMK